MLQLPNHGDSVKVWPMPGRRAQMDERPVDRMGGGRFIPDGGAVVEWSPFMHSQLLGGVLLLHPPPCEDHDHGSRGQDDCTNCGRTPSEAEQYDVHYAEGVKAAEDAAGSLPQHPHELELHPHSDELREIRKAEATADQERADALAEAEQARCDAEFAPHVLAAGEQLSAAPRPPGLSEQDGHGPDPSPPFAALQPNKSK